MVALVAIGIGIPTNVYGTALMKSDIGRSPEGVCITYGDEPDMKDLCDWINVCDDNPGDRINSSHKFCTGEAVRNILYPPGGCPEGFHSEEDDESGLCYTNEEGCEDGIVFTNDKQSCVYDDACEGYSLGNNCVSKEFYCSINDTNKQDVREYCFSDEDDCNLQLNGSRCDLPAYTETGLKGVYLAKGQIYCPNYMNNPTLSVFCNGEKGEGGYMYCNLRDELPFHFGIVCVDNPKLHILH